MERGDRDLGGRGARAGRDRHRVEWLQAAKGDGQQSVLYSNASVDRVQANTAATLGAMLWPGSAYCWDRTPSLAELDLPTLVIHGTDDVLIDVSGGEATAAAIPGAELVLIDGMGHDLPRELWPRFVDLIAANAARARSLEKSG